MVLLLGEEVSQGRLQRGDICPVFEECVLVYQVDFEGSSSAMMGLPACCLWIER